MTIGSWPIVDATVNGQWMKNDEQTTRKRTAADIINV